MGGGETLKITKKSEIVAGIDVGSHALRMKIAEICPDKGIKDLEVLRKPVTLGSDTYSMGMVSFESVDRTCDILKGFKKLMNEYKVKTYRAVATSAIREAKNKDYIVDQIKLKTGLNIELVDNSMERFITYKAIRDSIPNVKKLRNEGLMIVTVGSGSIEISIYIHNNLIFSQNIKLGALRLREVLSNLEGKTLNFTHLMEEDIASAIDRLTTLIEQEKCKHFIALGGEIRTISKVCNQNDEFNKLQFINKTDFISVYKELVIRTTEKISEEYGISQERAEILVPSMMIFKRFLDMTRAKIIHAPLISLRDGIVADIFDSKYDTERKKDFAQDIVSFARYLGMRYLYHQDHAEAVEKNSLLIFDKVKKLHGLNKRERVLLQLAAILHDTGKFINLNKHYVHSYNIIMGSELMGISAEELEIVANIARYHSAELPGYIHENFQRLSDKNKVVVSKLVAIIRIADALDKGHKQKIRDMKITLDEKKVYITAETNEDTLLEEWTFVNKADFFKEVFGVTPILKVKRKYGI